MFSTCSFHSNHMEQLKTLMSAPVDTIKVSNCNALSHVANLYCLWLQQAGLSPSMEHIKLFSSHLPHAKLPDILVSRSCMLELVQYWVLYWRLSGLSICRWCLREWLGLMKTTSSVTWGIRRLGHATTLYGNARQSLFQVVSSALSSLPIPIMDLFIFSRAPVDTSSHAEMTALKQVRRCLLAVLTMIILLYCAFECSLQGCMLLDGQWSVNIWWSCLAWKGSQREWKALAN